MELSDLIPDGSEAWKVGRKQLTYKKYVNIPICFIDGETIYVYLDKRIVKPVLKLVKKLESMQAEFYFMTPELSNPKGVERFHESVIHHYLRSYAQKEFFHGFSEIGFDLIHNMTRWAAREGCFPLIKEQYDEVKKEINRKSYDYYANKEIYEFPQEIRDDFDRVYREIQINQIL